MAEIKTCPECGVPEQVTSDHVWLNSGVVVQRSNETTRISFIESENLDPLYDGIGKIIGMRIDNAANHLMTVGMAQGLFEMAFDVESHVEWEVSAEGDLSVEITPRTVMETVDASR